jgi:large conductance mechanosensitive channel
MVGDFRAFLLRTNALALAIGVIIGTALSGIVNSLVNDILMPPIGFLLGGVDFSGFKIVLKAATGSDLATEVAIRYGALINAVIVFVVVALVVFWVGKLLIREAPPAPPAATKACPFCREANAPDASRCKFCTSAI